MILHSKLENHVIFDKVRSKQRVVLVVETAAHSTVFINLTRSGRSLLSTLKH